MLLHTDTSDYRGRWQAMVRPTARRRSTWTVDMACSTHSPPRRLVGSSAPSDSACRLHAPCSAGYRRLEQPWGSPYAGIACLRHAPCKSRCRQRLTWCSPPPCIACPRHALCSAEYLHQQQPWGSPCAGIACPRRAPYKTPGYWIRRRPPRA